MLLGVVDERVPELELAEMRGVADLHRAAPDGVARGLGLEVVESGAAQALVTARVDVLALNRVLGLGLFEPIPPRQVGELLARYRRAHVARAFVQVAPSPQMDALVDALLAQGLTRYNNWLRLRRGVDPTPEVDTDLRVECVGPPYGTAFGEIVAEGFGWSTSTIPWLAASLGRPGWQHYMAFDGKRAVATGALYVAGQTGWMTMAATRPDQRGRGAQSALIARRVTDAARLGCVRLSTETAEPTPTGEAPSFRNLIRLGFEVAYARPNYMWQA